MARRLATELLVERLADWGVDTVFGLPGDGINRIMEGCAATGTRSGSCSSTTSRRPPSWPPATPRPPAASGSAWPPPDPAVSTVHVPASIPALVDVMVNLDEPPLPAPVRYEQAKGFAQAWLRGQPRRATIASTLVRGQAGAAQGLA